MFLMQRLHQCNNAALGYAAYHCSMGGGDRGARAPPAFSVRGHVIQNAPNFFLVIIILFFIAVLKWTILIKYIV